MKCVEHREYVSFRTGTLRVPFDVLLIGIIRIVEFSYSVRLVAFVRCRTPRQE